MNGWSLVYEGFDPAQERLRETLCTLGNGYFATRGAAPESAADAWHYPGTYIAGCYDRLPSVVDGRTLEHEDLVNAPNWLPLTFRHSGQPWFSLHDVEVLSYRQELDLRRGILLRDLRVRDRAGRATRVESRRLVSMASPHLAALETSITPENWSGALEIRAALDGGVVNDLVARYRQLAKDHLVHMAAEPVGPDGVFLKVRTRQSEIVIAQAARLRLDVDGRRVEGAGSVTGEPRYIARDCLVETTAGRPVRIEKIVALYTSRDRAISECGLEARTAVARAGISRSWCNLTRSPGSTCGRRSTWNWKLKRSPSPPATPRSPPPPWCGSTSFICCRRPRRIRRIWTLGCRRGVFTARPIGATSSGTSSSSSRS